MLISAALQEPWWSARSVVDMDAIRLKENEDAPDTVIAYHKCKTGVRVSGYEFKSGGIKDQFLQAMRSYRVLAGAESNSSSAPNENTSQLNESDSGLQESDATFSQYDSLENRPHKLVRRQNNTWSQISTLPETQDVTSTLAETQEVSQSSTLFLTNNTVDDTPNKPEAKRPPDSPPPELTRLLKKRKTELGIPVEVDISVFLRLCLLDPTFPEFVEKIEQELCDVLKAD
ncbi:hypothetical protein SARC_08967 [Sphaeroforma arctica JP610]|uniref:Uncharacterized protein n=1 Tax=Sphaeroforma arctica JP610 TaxID=667725 RepID=A0A0L0FRM0_9EUKA|nr:hypothetical protein SARC_08967 [Sphaeroforma arctica JP610]KNC78608.1 hypothetical protein SARC_08967 [Sphaeroforma arctica JP610]|eukprot:XP_014152510.1 hypothetical protein SARC_08967 [Sphaeroforma arctica JP610]